MIRTINKQKIEQFYLTHSGENHRNYLSKVGWLVEFYGMSTFVGYLMPNPFLYK